MGKKGKKTSWPPDCQKKILDDPKSGRGGGGGGGDFEKKFMQALVGRKKLHAAQM